MIHRLRLSMPWAILLMVGLLPLTAFATWPVSLNYTDDESELAAGVATDGAGNTYVLATCENEDGDNTDVVVASYDQDGEPIDVWTYGSPNDGNDTAVAFVVHGSSSQDVVIFVGVSTPGGDSVIKFMYVSPSPVWRAPFNAPAPNGGIGTRITDMALQWQADMNAYGVAVCGVGCYKPIRDTDYLTVCYYPAPYQGRATRWGAWFDGHGAGSPGLNCKDWAIAIACNTDGVTGQHGGDVYVTGRVNRTTDGQDPADYEFCTVKYRYNSSDTVWTARYNFQTADDVDELDETPVDIVVDPYELYSVYVVGTYLKPGTQDDHYEAALWTCTQTDRNAAMGETYGDPEHDYVPVAASRSTYTDYNVDVVMRGENLDEGTVSSVTAKFTMLPYAIDLLWAVPWELGEDASCGPAGIATDGSDHAFVAANTEGDLDLEVATLMYNGVGFLRQNWSSDGEGLDSAVAVASHHPSGQDGFAVVAITRIDDGPRVIIERYEEPSVWAWEERYGTPIPPQNGKGVYTGGWSVFDPDDDMVYVAKGNSTFDFYRYDPDTSNYTPLVQMADVPDDPSGRKPKKGSAGCYGGGYIYATKGNNTNEFMLYDIAADTWGQKATVPIGASGKNVREGTGLVYVKQDGTGYVYLMKGYKNEFYRYNTVQNDWETCEPLPTDVSTSWKKGSWLVYDGAAIIYALQAGKDGFFAYDLETGHWGECLTPMPRVGVSGHSKRSGDGGCAVWQGGCIYALKGNSSGEFWLCAPLPASTSWGELDPLPKAGHTYNKYVKAGAGIWFYDGMFYALKGNKTREPWTYLSPDGASLDQLRRRAKPSLSLAASSVRGGRDDELPLIEGFDARRPRWDSSGTHVTYFHEDNNGHEQVYRIGVADSAELQLTHDSTDHQNPVFSPGGDWVAFQVFDTCTQRYQIAKTGTSGVSSVTLRTSDTCDHENPEWSPTGSWLAYQKEDQSGYTQVYIVDADSGDEICLTDDEADHEEPSWLTDSELVFILSPDDGNSQVAKVNVNSLVQSELTAEESDHENAAPSVDGTSIAYEVIDGSATVQIGLVSAAGDSEAVLTSGTTDKTEPVWSADGQSIYCVNWVSTMSEVGWVDAQSATGSFTAVTDDDAFRDNPDVHYNTTSFANDVAYERDGTTSNGDGPSQYGDGIFMVRSGKRDGGQSGAGLRVLALDRAEPNPATNRVLIRWQLPVEGLVNLKVYNTAGQVVNTLVTGKQKPGAYTTIWDGTDVWGRSLAAGVYFYRLESDGKRLSRKVVLTGR